MSVERDLAELPDGGGPRPGWEGRVLATARMPALARPERRPSVTFALAGAGAVVLASILFFALRREPTDHASERRLDQRVQEMESAEQDLEKVLAEKDAEFQKLLAADTAEEKAAAQQALARKNAEIVAKQTALKVLRDRSRAGGGSTSHEGDAKIMVKCDPADPLCGI
ncbi:MAG TPA: hypothetical protein VMZ28_28445 [Kofleriaceae bacterium]|nr:hypothetical protein [Kofleriaceae bacterium]